LDACGIEGGVKAERCSLLRVKFILTIVALAALGWALARVVCRIPRPAKPLDRHVNKFV
jgi:hypothetical protein